LLHRNRRADRRRRVVALEPEVLVAKREQIRDVGIQVHRRQGARLAFKLLAGLIEVVRVEVRVAERVHEVARFEFAHLRDHHRQEGITCNIEGVSGYLNPGTFRYEASPQINGKAGRLDCGTSLA